MPARPTPSGLSAWLGRFLAMAVAIAIAIAALPAAAAAASDGAGAGAGERDPAPLARLEIVDRGAGPEAWAENLLSGPIEVMLRATGAAPPAEPALPARATVPARARVLVSRIGRADAQLVLEVVPGHPGARPLDGEYAWPLGSRTLRVSQGWGGTFSHRDDENRHAVDFATPEGTPVLAAREGVVMQVEDRFGSGGLGSSDDTGRANFVRILHNDGTMALYAHLAPAGARVRAGERVRRGQRIATSGNTGYSGGPHLHFAVQANRGLRLVSLPFRMFGPGGILRFTDAAVGVEE
ncbi:M23 family metallopeptidase [Luteimonas sp. MC1895]|uniref:M23 family metallopeptidase n=1 Tax=Luteimonas sp. MC1895 TaxID=2819513 RepID=UPI001F1A8C38|nr:M23 family metallopeptidase [Luteimonas sp. MC1895]